METEDFLKFFHSTWLLSLFPALCPSTFCLEECGILALSISLSSSGLILLLDEGLIFSLSRYSLAEPFLRSTAISRFNFFCRRSASLLSSSSCSIRLLKASSCSTTSCRRTEPIGDDGELQGFLKTPGSGCSPSTLFLLEQMVVGLEVSKNCLQESGSELDVEGLLLESKQYSSMLEGSLEVEGFKMFS